MNRYSVLFILLNLYVANAHSDEFIIKSKGYIDTKSGEVVRNKFIYIKNNLITKISEIYSPEHKKIIDLSDYYILPGLVDSHSHLLITQTLEDKTFENAILREAKLSDKFRLIRAKTFLKQYLQAGFTSLFDLGNSGYFLDAKLRDETKNNSLYPQLFISGPGIATEKGQFEKSTPLDLVNKEYFIVTPSSNLNGPLKEYVAHKVDILKIYLDNSPGIGTINEVILKKILTNKYISFFKKITFHSITPEGAALIKKFNLKNVEHFTYYNGQTDSNSIQFATPTDLTKKTLLEFNYYSPVEFLAQKGRTHFLKNSNIKILFGPDFYFHINRPSFNRADYIKSSIHAFVEAGLSPLEIIKSMTINPALSLKIENQIGQIRVGNYANLIATKGNPVENIDALNGIYFIMNRGKIILQIGL